MELSQTANLALSEITAGQFTRLSNLAVTGLLNDFQYAWLRRFDIKYDFDILDVARSLCAGENKAVFRVTGCKSIKAIRNKFTHYIKSCHKKDDRIILSLTYDGNKINAVWMEMKHYVEQTRG